MPEHPPELRQAWIRALRRENIDNLKVVKSTLYCIQFCDSTLYVLTNHCLLPSHYFCTYRLFPSKYYPFW